MSTRKLPNMFLSLPVLACALAAPGLLGCDKGEGAEEAAAQQEEVLPDLKVTLPPTPDFDEGKAPEKWEGDIYSIYGLRQNIDDRLEEGKADTKITIKGFVQEVYVPPVCEEGKFCPPGKQPHVWITDHAETQGKKHAMMVVNYAFSIPEWDAERWVDAPPVVLEKGKQYTFKGKFVRFSSTGFAHDRGLLEFDSYQVLNEETGQMEWRYPPGAAWHPLELERQEAENAELAEKAKQTAEDYKNRGKPEEG